MVILNLDIIDSIDIAELLRSEAHSEPILPPVARTEDGEDVFLSETRPPPILSDNRPIGRLSGISLLGNPQRADQPSVDQPIASPERVFRTPQEALRYVEDRLAPDMEVDFSTLPEFSPEFLVQVERARANAINLLGDQDLGHLWESFLSTPPVLTFLQTNGSEGQFHSHTNVISIYSQYVRGSDHWQELMTESDLTRLLVHEFTHYLVSLGNDFNIHWSTGENETESLGFVEWFDEGVTELYTQQLVRDAGTPPTYVAYDYEVAVAFYMQRLLENTNDGETGKLLLRDAHLSGDFTEVRRLINARFSGLGPEYINLFDQVLRSEDPLAAYELLCGAMRAAAIDYQALAAVDPIMQDIDRHVDETTRRYIQSTESTPQERRDFETLYRSRRDIIPN